VNAWTIVWLAQAVGSVLLAAGILLLIAALGAAGILWVVACLVEWQRLDEVDLE
jgi:uncharacterized membrane protein YphA (DoxX/SURF4 family)